MEPEPVKLTVAVPLVATESVTAPEPVKLTVAEPEVVWLTDASG